MKKLQDAGYRLHREKNFFKKRKPNRSKWDQTITRQIGSDNKNRRTKERERVEIVLGSDPMPIEVYQKSSSANRYPQKITLKKQNEWN